MTWLWSAISVGVAAGSAATGRIVDGLGPRWGYSVAAAFGIMAVTICLLGRGRLGATTDTQAAQWVDAEGRVPCVATAITLPPRAAGSTGPETSRPARAVTRTQHPPP